MKVTTKTERTWKWYMRLKKEEIRTVLRKYCEDLGIPYDGLKYLHWDKQSLSTEVYKLYLETLK